MHTICVASRSSIRPPANAIGAQAQAEPRTRLIFDDPEAMGHAAAHGLGVALIPMPHAVPLLAAGKLVRVLPGWYAELGTINLYYPNKKLLPPPAGGGPAP